ncbi:MAG: sulfotransferase domain-containing protein [Gemmataceae bacterium]
MEFWLASYPRSGNSYFRILLRNRYGIPSIDQECPEQMETETLKGTRIVRAHYHDPNAPPEVRGLKTHKPPEEGDTRPAIYVVRDGRDSLVSYAHFALALVRKQSEETVTPEVLRNTIRDLILEQNSPYRTWSQNVDAWVARKNTVVCRFEELVTQPARVADRAVAGLGLRMPVVSREVPTFKDLKSVDPKFFRKGQRGEWQEVFTPDLHEMFWKHNGETMTRFGYLKDPAVRRAA